MKKLIFLLLTGFLVIPLNTMAQNSGSFSDDYVWQDLFKSSMSNAEKGNAKSQYKVGEMYEKGRGTARDSKQAFAWYSRSAKQNYIKAQYKLGYLYFKGIGVKQDRTKSYALLQKPAEKGNVRAQYYLGRLYASGHGVEKNPELALIWYSRSSLGGYSPAEDALAEVKQHLAKLNAKPAPAKKVAKKKSVNKPKKVAKTKHAKSVKVVKRKVLSGKILQGSWMKRKKPAEFLPSKFTKCERQSASIVECLSKELKRNIGPADIVYITKALLFDMKQSGDFKVAYRNKILEIKQHNTEVSDDEDGPVKITVKKGWQETEHKLECKVTNKSTINCIKNKVRKMKFNRNVKT